MSTTDRDRERLLVVFRQEVREYTALISSGLLCLEEGGEGADLDGMFRAAHSLKGSARLLNLPEIERLAHALEDLLGALRAGRLIAGRDEIDLALRAVDTIRAIHAAYDAGHALPEEIPGVLADLRTLAPADAAGSPTDVPKTGTRPPLVDDLHQQAVLLTWDQLDTLARIQEGLAQVALNVEAHLAQLGTLPAGLRDNAGRLGLLTRQLDAQLRQVRLLPFRFVAGDVARMVRDLAHQLGKQARLRIVGGETLLERGLLERLIDPLVHLVRNAVDHGIEAPDVRVAAGKPAAGRIELRAVQQGHDVVLSVSDDGAGLDLDAVRGVVGNLPESELIDAIFRPGVSTRAEVTAVSGRGVGLDVVGRTVAELRGTVSVSNRPGQGATFTLRVPSAVRVGEVLLVRVAGVAVGVPLPAVEHVLLYQSGSLEIVWDGQALPVVSVAGLFGRAEQLRPDKLVMIVRAGRGAVALLADEIESQVSLVVRRLPFPLTGRLPLLAGTALLGTGEAAVVLAPDVLVQERRRRPPACTTDPAAPPPAAPARRRRILLVDDSLLIRALERGILESVGFEVAVAADGREALEMYRRRGDFDVVLTDLVMPNMDGLQLARLLRQDQRDGRVPIIMLTAQNSPGGCQAAAEAGVDRYLVKADFGREQLLSAIEELIG